MSHDEYEKDRNTLQRFLFPGVLWFSLEILIAALLLVVINFTTFEETLLGDYPSDLTFTSYSSGLLDLFLSIISQTRFMGQLVIFAVWATVGMLVYIVAFRIIQAVYGVSNSVNTGLKYMRTEHTHGIIHWLGTLHNFFLLSTTRFIGLVIFSVAIFLALVVAEHQVQVALVSPWPSNVVNMCLGLLATIVGVRLIVIGLCLVLPRFARWYLA